jgi:hypothetical protein
VRLFGSILALLIAAFLGIGAAANYVYKCTTLTGIPEIGVQNQRLCTNDTRAGTIFAALAIVFLVFAVLAFRAHLKHRRRRRDLRRTSTP